MMNTITIQLRTALLLFMFPGILFSQQVLEKESVPSQPKLSAGFHGGISFTSITSNMLAFPETGVNFNQLKRKVNFSARMGVQFIIHIANDYGIETGVNYEKGGVKLEGFLDPLDGEYKTSNLSSTTFTYEYITIPILYKRNFTLDKKTTIGLHAGLYFGFLESSNYGFKTIDILVDADGNFTERNREFNFSLEEYSRSVDAGIRLQLGLQRKVSELGTLYLLSHYSRGLRSVDDFNGPGGSSGVHQIFGFSLGGYFTMM